MIGVLGGMGPLATAIFYAMLTNKQKVSAEQEHHDIIIYSKPSIPDRTAFILGQSEISPLSDMIHVAKTLQHAGASFIAIPCVTSHYFYQEIVQAVDIPVIHVVDEIAKHIFSKGFKKVGVLATNGTLAAGLFQNAFEKHDIEMLQLNAQKQTALMEIIYDIKHGQYIKSENFDALEEALFCRGVQAVVLGCTELSMVTGPVIKERVDALEVLANVALEMSKKSP